MTYSNLQLEKRPPIARITLDRPKALNALNIETLGELAHAVEDLAADAQIRVILLTGSGDRAFAAGADIRELAAIDPGEARAFALRGQGVFRRIETLGKPVIACINGFALGGGCELALACTLRIAAETAKLGQPEVKLGILPGYGGSQRLPRLVGRSAALKLILTGAIIDAQEALRIGLVDEVVPASELTQRAEALALEIAANAPMAIAESINTVDSGLDETLEAALAMEADAFARLAATADKREGTQAFIEKRAPAWKGE
jgi:enoyl-CoA hydratase